MSDSQPSTLVHLLQRNAAVRPHAIALRHKSLGAWRCVSWAELQQQVRDIACGLARAGVGHRQVLALAGASRPRLVAAMLAAQSAGAAVLLLDAQARPQAYAQALADAQAMWAIAQGQQQLAALMQAHEHGADLIGLWFEVPRGLHGHDAQRVASLEQLAQSGAAWHAEHPGYFEAMVARVAPGDPALVLVSDLGAAKTFAHHDLLAPAQAAASRYQLTSAEEVLADLSPSDSSQVQPCIAQWLLCGYTLNCPESAQTVGIDMREIGPTYFAASPARFEAMRRGVTAGAGGLSLRCWLLDVSLFIGARAEQARVSGMHAAPGLRAARWLAERAGLAPLRHAMGLGRVRVACALGAPGNELAAFYGALGIPLHSQELA